MKERERVLVEIASAVTDDISRLPSQRDGAVGAVTPMGGVGTPTTPRIRFAGKGLAAVLGSGRE